MKKTLILSAALGALAFDNASALGQGFNVGVNLGFGSTTTELKGAMAYTGATAADVAAVNTALATEANLKRNSSSGFNGSLLLGYDRMINNLWVEVSAGVTYDSTKVTVATVADAAAMATTATAATAAAAAAGANMTAAQTTTDTALTTIVTDTAWAGLKQVYKPQLGIQVLGVRLGRAFNPQIVGFIGVALGVDFGKLSTSFTTAAAAATQTAFAEAIGSYTSSNITNWYIAPEVGLKGAINDKISWSVSGSYQIALSTTSYPAPNSPVFAWSKKPSGFVVQAGLSYNF